ncbi:MAG: 3-deoxy-manno-octulosonate cytidylyltransferase [Alphaproteobacteria bacterium]|nr:3-deoxy-manno-octulosonate cytidylyltransferase [Alphaproteobacteria bacterium]
MSHSALIVIPARMASTRLPGKPLADIAGRPLIIHVLERAVEADVGPVLVACSELEVAEAVRAAGGAAAMTDPDLLSGSDRIRAALDIFDPGRRFDRIVNLQGDLPTVPPGDIRAALALLDDLQTDIGTVAARIVREEERDDPNVVKAVFGLHGRALYFTRATAPSGPGPLFHHIGLYAWRRAALERFTTLPPSQLEQRERLEQLRALEAGMRISVAVVDSVPLGVDTPADLARAREFIAAKP